MSYLTYYNLMREPFSNAPDKRFFFNNQQHDRALRRLEYVAENSRGFGLCTGPIGHGKTTLARRLYDILPGDKYHKALLVVIHSDITSDWLLMKFAKLLGVAKPKKTKVEVLGQIYMRLRAIDSAGKKAVILIDEAQMLADRNLMEEFRGLLNIEIKGRKHINFIFFGLPDIEDCLRLDEPLRQRVALRVLLEPYKLEETQKYIHHRIQVAGGGARIFSNEVVGKIHSYTKGTPRLINTICDNLLLEGYFNKSPLLKSSMVDKLAESFHLVKEASDDEISVHKETDQSILDQIRSNFDDPFPDPLEATDREVSFRSAGDETIDKLIRILDK